MPKNHSYRQFREEAENKQDDNWRNIEHHNRRHQSAKGTKIGSVIRIKNRMTGFINDINHEKIIRITTIKE